MNSVINTTAQDVAATFKRLFPKNAVTTAAKNPVIADTMLDVE